MSALTMRWDTRGFKQNVQCAERRHPVMTPNPQVIYITYGRGAGREPTHTMDYPANFPSLIAQDA